MAGSLHVTVTHADGIRTSYSYLARVTVVRGASVRLGEPVGLSGRRLHVGARRGDTYIDPASLWSRGPPRVQLVPLDGGGPEGSTGPRATPAAPTDAPGRGWRRFARWLV